MFCVAHGIDSVPGDISGEKSGRYSPVEWGTWRDRDSPTMPWEIGSAKKPRSHGGYNPYILRTNADNEILKVLTAYKSASMKGSPKSVKFDSESILVSPNVVVGKCAVTEGCRKRRDKSR